MRRWNYAIATLPLLSLLVLAAPTSQRPDSVCDAEAFLTADRPRNSITAAQVMMQPWRGQHYTYGLFVLPNWVPPGSAVLLAVKGVGVYCDAHEVTAQDIDGVTVAANHHIMRDHIRTRSALWAIAEGKLTQLQDRRNWVMWY